MKTLSISHFQKIILAHYAKHGRKLPWRASPTPYHVVVSEIMLQQTQVDRVVPKYQAFIKRFPSFQALAKAPGAAILRAWSGLGYNRRALALKKIAEEVTRNYKGKLPNDLEKLDALPGIGPATAYSIAVYAFNQPEPFIETNVRAVYIHLFFKDKKKVTDDALLPLVEKTLDRSNPRQWFNALMDYGVKLKKEFKNPARHSAHHTKQTKFEGSNRQMRGAILKALTVSSGRTVKELAQIAGRNTDSVLKNISELEAEGFLKKKGARIYLKN